MLASLNPTTKMSFRFPPPNSSFSITRGSPAKTIVKAFTASTTSSLVNNAGRPENLYQVLQVKHNASSTEIKTAYRNLAKRFHPDVSTPEFNSNDFVEIHNAYATLSDPSARGRYDLSVSIRAKRFRYKAVDSGVGCVGAGGRRWETDQCW